MSNQVAEERIERAERCAAQFAATHDLVLVVGEDALVLYVSGGWERVFGLPLASMVGNSFDVMLTDCAAKIVETDSPAHTPHQNRTANLGESILLRCPHPDAGYRILEGRVACSLEDSTDRLMIFRDTTADWKALATLADNERRFRVVAEASRDMVTETDETGRFIYVSSACQKVLGYQPEDLLGTLALDLLHPADTGLFLDSLKDGRMSTEPFSVPPHRLQHRDGSHVWVEATGLIYRNLDGLERTVGVVRDITSQVEAGAARRNLEQRVLRSQKLESLGALAGGVAHDFNNLLTPIIGNVGLALLDLPAESPIRKRIEMIRVAANRATALTRQMLAYAGRGVPGVEAVNISAAIEEMALLVEAAASKSTRVVYELQNDLPFIEVDNTHIGQIVMNLVANASESFPSTGGRIEIKTGSLQAGRDYLDSCFIGDDLKEGLYVYLEVSDDGPGIPVEDRNRIFDPFFTTRFTGRGLGLSAVDGIVRGYNGALDFISETEQGTRIRVLFPTTSSTLSSVRSAEAQVFPDEEQTSQGTRETILVVDDDESACELMASVLARAGFKVIQASGGAAAVKLYERRWRAISGVVLDYTMPLVSGGDAFNAIREICPDARVLLVSGYAQARVAEELMERGLVGFLQKPFVPADLVRNVNLLIEEDAGE